MQVFISSTYKDLIEERQATVEAVLKADHIPAGMELFKAGDETQLTVIKRWIDQSDIYMLIVGGRYGSIEHKSGLSYTHLEFNMAIESGIPMFAIILNEEMSIQKTLSNTTQQFKKEEIFETKPKLKKLHKAFIDEVAGDNRIVSYVDSIHHLRAEVFVSLNDIIKTKKLSGWVRATDNNLISENIALKEKIITLTEEMNSLKNKAITDYSSIVEAVMLPQPTLENISGFSMNQIVDFLRQETIVVDLPYDIRINSGLTHTYSSALEIFLNSSIRTRLINGIRTFTTENDELEQFILSELIPVLKSFNLVDTYFLQDGFTPNSYILNPNGSFVLGKLLNR